MANIEKRGDSYRITVSCGYGVDGRKKRTHMTWKPDKGMTERQIKKELERQAVLFEEQCATGQFISSNITFKDFAEKWLEDYADKQLRPRTVARYRSMLPRIYAAIGHIKLNKIQPHQLIEFYNNLEENGIRLDTKYSCTCDFNALLDDKGMTKTELADKSGVGTSTVRAVARRDNVSAETADKIAAALGVDKDVLFTPVIINGGSLSAKTILHHHRLISSILATAVQWQVIVSNPCDRVKPPKVERTEPKYLDEVGAAHMIELLENEPIQYRTMILVLLFTGLRRGELLGLKWEDIDFDNKLMNIHRSTLYTKDKGIFDDETKNATSTRIIKLPDVAVSALTRFKVWQNTERVNQGDSWRGYDKIFTSPDGGALHPDTLSAWFSHFVKRNNLGNISLHSLRHTNATLQIAGGVPVTTVASRLGHATPATTTKIYAHAIKSADEAAADTLQNILAPSAAKKKKSV